MRLGRLLAASFVGLVALVEGVYVAGGMISLRDPDFEKGTSPPHTVVFQETVGAITLLFIALTLIVLLRTRARWLAFASGLLAFSIVSGAVWMLAAINQRAS